MADDLPVCDVLCEAMEYLSKLGSNLRTRSDILKEKRIRRDKLKNAHAVKKAANKVLLICELSKKSLENVETGVKKLLNLVGASQSRPGPLGGKNARRESETERKPSLKREVHYFEYQSQKLKVAKKVSLKHFTSVKVMATKMPKLWLDKYPVYHDCKLYRLRMKQASNEIVDELKESDSPSSSKEDIDEDGRSCHKHKSTSSETEKNEDTSDSVRVNQNEKGDDCHLPVIMPGAHQKKNEMDINQKDSNLDKRESNEHKNDQDKKNSETNCKSEEYKKSDLKRQSSEDSESSRERQRSKERERSKSRSQSEDKQKESKGESKTKRIGPGAHDKSKDERKKSSKKHQRTDRKERESFDSERNKDKRKQNRGRSKINLISDDDDEDVKPHKNLGDSSDNSDQELTRPRKKHRRLKILDDSSENSENESNIDTKSKTNTENLAVIKASNSENTQLVSSKNLIESDENDLVDDLKEPKTVDSADDGSKNCETDTKPLIKCVSLSRLLKPDVLEKVVDKTIKDNNKTAGKKNNGTIELSKKKNREEEEAFWALKRKEVKAFKAKQFYINVIKMPNFSQDFLNIHGLKKITQNNLVLFEVPQTTLEEDKEMGPDLINENNSESKNTDTDAVEPAVLDEFKNALLNDTDSEKSQDSPANLVNESENAKSTLLHDSDSDNHIESNKQTSTENIAGETDLVPNKDQEISEVDNQESLPVEREKTPEKGSEMILTDTDLAKSLLLDNSTPTTPSNPMEKPRKKSSSVTPSKRKHIMESMHAKKMLLTYSSSSEADDDEQLKTVVKEVQQQLLKASSDEEVAASQELVSRKKRLTSSDSESDGELLRRAKKKKKLNSISDNSDDDCQKDENSHQNDQDGLNSQNGCDTNKQQENSTPSDDLQGSLNSQGLSEVGPEDVETNCQADVSETQRDPNKVKFCSTN